METNEYTEELINHIDEMETEKRIKEIEEKELRYEFLNEDLSHIQKWILENLYQLLNHESYARLPDYKSQPYEDLKEFEKNRIKLRENISDVIVQNSPETGKLIAKKLKILEDQKFKSIEIKGDNEKRSSNSKVQSNSGRNVKAKKDKSP